MSFFLVNCDCCISIYFDLLYISWLIKSDFTSRIKHILPIEFHVWHIYLFLGCVDFVLLPRPMVIVMGTSPWTISVSRISGGCHQLDRQGYFFNISVDRVSSAWTSRLPFLGLRVWDLMLFDVSLGWGSSKHFRYLKWRYGTLIHAVWIPDTAYLGEKTHHPQKLPHKFQ